MKNDNQIEIIDNREIELLDKNRKINLQKLFTREGIDLIINEIKNEVADFKADVNTKEGRASIKSMAAKIAKCKTPIKNLSMELKEESRKLIDGVNLCWNRYEAEIDNLRDTIRKPVDEIEEREARELQEKQDRLAQMQNLALKSFTNSSQLENFLIDLKIIFNYNWGDFEFVASKTFEEISLNLNNKLEAQKKYEEEQTELEKLRKEKAERDKKDREAEIARLAVEQAKKDEEARIKKIEKDKIDAENRAKEADELRKKAEEKAKQDAIIAEEKAKEEAVRLAQKAVEDERKRVADQLEKERIETEKRESNKRHRAKIEKESQLAIENILKNMHNHNDDFEAGELVSFENVAEVLIKAIAENKIPNIQINY